MNLTCMTCNVDLTGTNWYGSTKVRDIKICKSCSKKLAERSNPNRMYVNGKYVPRKHPFYKPGRYKTFNDAAFEGTYKLSSIKEGYVYAITNKAWPDWVKIGMAIDAEDRLSGYQTSSPHRDYILEHSVYSNEKRKAEQQAHSRAAKLAIEVNGEWFKLTVQQAIEVLDNLDEYRRETIKETNTNTSKDKLQEQPIQADLWAYAENG